MTIMKYVEDVVIVGGGPAGSYCAFNLARQGFKPVILDHSHPREKPCGGGISPPVLKKFPFLEKFRSRGFTFGNFKIISCIDTQVMTKSLENGFCISRKRFDQGLLEMAIKSGAKLVKEKVLDVRQKGKIWNVKTNKMTFSTKVLVGADGVNSLVARSTGLNKKWTPGSLVVCRVVEIPIPNSEIIQYYGEDNEYHFYSGSWDQIGYGWLFPKGDTANVGLGVKQRANRSVSIGALLKGFIDRLAKEGKIPAIRIGKRRWVIPKKRIEELLNS